MAQGVLFRIDQAHSNGPRVDLDVIVCFSGSDVLNGSPDTRQVTLVNIDPSGTINQIQAALASEIRARGSELGYIIPVNGVTLLGLTKG